MTIDYGYPAVELYAPQRKNGTLLCYYRHRVEENPYIRVGLQDLTCHVDFTTLIRQGEELGLTTVWFGEQYRFLMGAGMLEEMMALDADATSEEERMKNRLALKKLILPEGGMGDTYKVLIQAKEVDNPRLLCMREWGKDL
jgi:SAM-dependent MidA family methyltransferase